MEKFDAQLSSKENKAEENIDYIRPFRGIWMLSIDM